MFGRVADARGWPDDHTGTLQCVLTGKAQEAYSALSVTDNLDYDSVLKAHEMAPEAYHQLYQTSRKEDKHSYLEFSRDLWINSICGCSASEA